MTGRFELIDDDPDRPGHDGSPPPAAEADRPTPSWDPILYEAEPDAPTTLDTGWAPAPIAQDSGGPATLAMTLAGIAILFGSWAAFSLVNFLISLSATSTWLAAAAGAATALGLGLIARAGQLELRSYRQLSSVETLRRTLADDRRPVEDIRAAAIDWIGRIPSLSNRRDQLLQALHAATTPAEVRAILRNRVVPQLMETARKIGRRAAVDGAGLVAISPHASWDGVIAGVRGVRVVKQVATVFGVRPGPLVTLSLAKKVAWTAASTAGTDLLAQSLTDQVLGNVPVIRHIAAALPGSGVAAIRLYRLASIAALACCPVDP